MSSRTPSPTPTTERIVSLDALRGIAVLGILIINVRVFAMPEATLLNPTVYGDLTGANYLVWLLGHILAELKFITLFSLLFGAGVMLFFDHKGGDGDPPLRLHYRRTGWLLFIGVAHAYLLWYGDILVAYAICGLWIVFVRGWTPTVKLAAGTLMIAVPSVLEVATAATAPPELIAEQWRPAEETLRREVETYQSGWVAQLEHRVPAALERQTVGFVGSSFWRTSGVMLFGMALYELGVLTDRRSNRFYRRLAVVGLVVGLVPIVAGVVYIEAADWATEAALYWRQFNYWGSLPLAAGYIGVIYLGCRRLSGGIAVAAMAAVGRMAFTNYLFQTVLATTLFYGHGLGLFGQLSRIELVGVVLAIWTIQIPLSVLWLRRYRYGPVEWLWRTLTYKEIQPIRRA
ncbi:DUF418 domain-containing protein [Halorubrum vacuolatum]|uniref:DUF418 domain-containing protein n=1 Tax=Halorubrum vacuolatum TaxID=63740 RepID=A0A238XDU1_HALVU|nr:DUF418 domain-containing protein [Halorubrum vacuolatum]SNR56059.1 uncharacterized protein SAMN06264855_11559 [Halorubrum vacuolatum]